MHGILVTETQVLFLGTIMENKSKNEAITVRISKENKLKLRSYAYHSLLGIGEIIDLALGGYFFIIEQEHGPIEPIAKKIRTGPKVKFEE